MKAPYCFSNNNFHVSQGLDSVFSDIPSSNPSDCSLNISWRYFIAEPNQGTEIARFGGQLKWRDLYYLYLLQSCTPIWSRSSSQSSLHCNCYKLNQIRHDMVLEQGWRQYCDFDYPFETVWRRHVSEKGRGWTGRFPHGRFVIRRHFNRSDILLSIYVDK